MWFIQSSLVSPLAISEAMSRVIKLSISCCLLIVLTACGGGGSSSSGAGTPTRIVALGDSIGNGFGGTGGWPGRLQGLLNVPVVNSSINGSIINDGLNRVGALIAAEQPSHVLVLLGANDANSGEDLNASIMAMSMLVSIARQANVVPVIATVLPNTRTDGVNERTQLLTNGIITIPGAVIADPRILFGENQALFQSDRLHPTAAGQQLIAEAFFAQF